MDQVVKLERDDDIYHLRSLIKWNEARRVIIIAPRSCQAFNQEHELHLLRRWADETGTLIAIAPPDDELRGLDARTREYAKQAGILTFGSVSHAQRAQWRANGTDAFSDERLQTLGERRRGSGVEQISGLSWWQLATTALLLVVVAGALVIGAYWLVPSATVRITPAAQPLFNTSSITLDPTAPGTDVENATIIARVIAREISGTASIATTKTQNAPATRATGQVVFTNLAGIEAPIPRGTIVHTSAGVTVRFSTTVAATLPPQYGARVTVPVQAIDLGPIGNVRALQINTIEGPVAGAARVINPNATGGGAVRPVNVVTRDDKSKLKAQLTAQMQQVAIRHLLDEADRAGKEAGVDFFLVADSVKVSIADETYDHLVDDPADNLGLRMEAQATGVVVSRKRLLDFATSVLRSEVAPGFSMLPNSVQIEIDPGSAFEKGLYVIKLRSVAYQIPQVNTNSLIRGVAGLTLNEARDRLATEVRLAQPPRILLYPTGWQQMPLLGFRIALFVDLPTELSPVTNP